VIPIYTLQVYDRVLSSRSNETLFFLTVGIVLALLIVVVTDIIKSRMLVRLANNLEHKLHTTIMNAIILNSANGVKGGVLPLKDHEKIKNFLAGTQGLITLFDAPWIPIFIFIVFMIHPMLSVVLIIYMVVLFVLTLLTDKTTAPHLKKASESSVESYAKADEITRNAQMIEAMGMRKAMIHYWFTSSGLSSYYQSISSDKAALFTSLAKFVRYSQNIVLTAFGAYLAINNEMTVGGMIAANILAAKAAAPMEGLIASWKNLYTTKESLGRLNEMLTKTQSNHLITKMPPPKGDLSILNVIFNPNENSEPIIKNVSFELKGGDFVGIIGPSASGKSTLAKLLVGIYKATSGSIRLDGADLNNWDKEQLGQYVGYLPQDVTMITGTIRENIGRFHLHATDEEIIEASMKANAHELILKLPKGYDTPVGVGGHILSGGQRQRIGLARAFFGNPKIIVLDEPNSSLDSDGDIALIRAITTMKALGSTIIVIAHRPSILQNADKLLVLSNGQIQLFGGYKEVLAQLTPPKQN
jgi:PrtD family type I secretion system ABC transporter